MNRAVAGRRMRANSNVRCGVTPSGAHAGRCAANWLGCAIGVEPGGHLFDAKIPSSTKRPACRQAQGVRGQRRYAPWRTNLGLGGACHLGTPAWFAIARPRLGMGATI